MGSMWGMVLMATVVAGTTPGALTNVDVVLPHVVPEPYDFSSEDTSVVSPDEVKEVRLRCGGVTKVHNRVDRPVFCEYETWDSCGNRFGSASAGDLALFTAQVTKPDGSGLAGHLIADIVHGGSVGIYRFHFTPPVVGVYKVSLTYVPISPTLSVPPRDVLVVVSAQDHSCTTAPRVVSSRESLQAHMHYHNLHDRVVTSHHKPVPTTPPTANAIKGALNAKPDPMQLPPTHLLPDSRQLKLRNPLFPHNAPPRFNKYPHVPDGFCQGIDKPL